MNSKPTAIITIKDGRVQKVSMDSGIIIIIEDYDCPDKGNDNEYIKLTYQK